MVVKLPAVFFLLGLLFLLGWETINASSDPFSLRYRKLSMILVIIDRVVWPVFVNKKMETFKYNFDYS